MNLYSPECPPLPGPADVEVAGSPYKCLPMPRLRFLRSASKSLNRRTGSLAPRWHCSTNRQNAMVHPVAANVDLVSFWLDQRIGGGGTGPCLALYCFGYEVLRFDCFGGERGHFHAAPFTPWSTRSGRFRFEQKTIAAQIEHSLFELTENLDCYLHMNPRRRVRQLRVPRAQLLAACDRARARLAQHLASVPVLQALLAAEGARQAA